MVTSSVVKPSSLATRLIEPSFSYSLATSRLRFVLKQPPVINIFLSLAVLRSIPCSFNRVFLNDIRLHPGDI